MQKENGKQFSGGGELTRSLCGGFTLIEIIVATSIFTVVMLVTMGALLTLNDSSRKAQALRTVIDNLNFAVEDMNRKIRTGDKYHCYDGTTGDVVNYSGDLGTPRDSTSAGCFAISLSTQEKVNGNPVWVAYIYKVDEATGLGRIVQLRTPEGHGGASLDMNIESSITSPEVDINKMEFRVIGTGDEGKQPMVIVNISGVVNLQKEKLRSEFSLQTAISKRGIVPTDE